MKTSLSSSQKRQNLPARISLCAQHQPCSGNSPPKNVQHTVETFSCTVLEQCSKPTLGFRHHESGSAFGCLLETNLVTLNLFNYHLGKDPRKTRATDRTEPKCDNIHTPDLKNVSKWHVRIPFTDCLNLA